jgi:cation/acetate symporter
MSIGLWTVVFVGGSFALYLAIAWWARVRDTKGFYVAGRGVPASANGMAILLKNNIKIRKSQKKQRF